MNLPFTTYLDSGTQFLAIDDVPLVTAFARYPARADETEEYEIKRQLLRIEYEGAVSRAIEAGTITPLNPFSLERHTSPRGNALKEAVITLDDYKRFAASLQIRVEIKQSSRTLGMIKTIAETAEYLSAYLLIDDIPDGDSSPEFRLSMLRKCQIKPLAEKLLWLVKDGELTARTPTGTSCTVKIEPTESTLIDVSEAKAVLDADAPFGKLFEDDSAWLPGADSPISLNARLQDAKAGWPSKAEFAEYIANGAFINWPYWAGKMPILTPQQAARLMAGLDPDIFESLNTQPNRNDSTKQCTHAKNIERLAIAEQITNLTPCEWLKWADKHEFEVHDAFRDAVLLSDDTCDQAQAAAQIYSWPGIAAEQENTRRNAGRYQIREAAEQLQIHAGERADTMIEKLSMAAFRGNLPVHLPGEKARHAYPQDGIVRGNVSTLPGGVSYFAGSDWRQHVRDFYEEAYWDDLNAWLSENEPRIDWRFPNPQHKNDKEIMVDVAEEAQVSLSGLGRKEILSVDWPLINGFNEDSFSRALSDVPNWLKPARIAKGAPGKGSALWNPAIVAACLLEKNYARQAALTNLMRKSFPDWLEQ